MSLQESTAHTDALCASCGRFVGPYESCPYCGARIQGRVSTRVVKIVAVVLATVGLLTLWWMARHMEVPTVSAGDVMGTMNMAYVQVQGHIARSLTYDPGSGYLAFWVDDGTGEVRVSAYRDVTTALLAADKVPVLGDEVTVAGTLRIREDYAALTVNVPEHLALSRPAPTRLQANELTILDEGLRVSVVGEVRQLNSPYAGLTLITVRDASGEIVVAVDETITALTGELPDIVQGQGIAVTATVSLYRDTPQLVPGSVTDIDLFAVPPEPVVDSRALNTLFASDQGTRVQVTGRVVLLEGFKGGVKATLDDGTAQVLLLLWDSVYSALEDPIALDAGADVRVEGEIQIYEGDLEIVPKTATDVQILIPAPDIPWVEVGELRTVDVGHVVRVRGVLGKPKGFSAGIKVGLDDGTGRITLLLWNNIVTALATRPAEHALVEVVGEVTEYQGELEIIPRSIHDWRLGDQ